MKGCAGVDTCVSTATPRLFAVLRQSAQSAARRLFALPHPGHVVVGVTANCIRRRLSDWAFAATACTLLLMKNIWHLFFTGTDDIDAAQAPLAEYVAQLRDLGM